MIVSEARVSANRLNGCIGNGPLSPESRAISARNSLKHGLTGKGIVVSEGEREEIDRRIEGLTEDMKPISQAGVLLIEKMATLSRRAENAAEQEAAAISRNVRHAADDFDEQQPGPDAHAGGLPRQALDDVFEGLALLDAGQRHGVTLSLADDGSDPKKSVPSIGVSLLVHAR
jgi:hypothetical protein